MQIADASNFLEWAAYARQAEDPDALRTALYCGFQPLYDALLDEHVRERETALVLFDTLVQTGRDFLTGYYTGKPDAYIFRRWLCDSREALEKLDGTPYVRWPRNMELGTVKPIDVSEFLRKGMEMIENGKLERPATIVGCACGASELAMPLAGLLGSELQFVRYSARRGDKEARVLPEHEEQFARASGKPVLCVDDFTETGETLHHVMKKTEEYNPSSVRGASAIHWNDELEMQGTHIKNPSFHMFRRRKNR